MILTQFLIVLHRCCRVHTLPNPVLRANNARNTKLQLLFQIYTMYGRTLSTRHHRSTPGTGQEKTVQHRGEPGKNEEGERGLEGRKGGGVKEAESETGNPAVGEKI